MPVCTQAESPWTDGLASPMFATWELNPLFTHAEQVSKFALMKFVVVVAGKASEYLNHGDTANPAGGGTLMKSTLRLSMWLPVRTLGDTGEQVFASCENVKQRDRNWKYTRIESGMPFALVVRIRPLLFGLKLVVKQPFTAWKKIVSA